MQVVVHMLVCWNWLGYLNILCAPARSAPTYILSECVLVYMEAVDSAAVVTWLGTQFTNAVMAIYEQVSGWEKQDMRPTQAGPDALTNAFVMIRVTVVDQGCAAGCVHAGCVRAT